MAISPGSRLAHYEVISLLGVGGMGAVYLALDTRLDRKVALKLLSGEFMQDLTRVHRFEQVAKVASALNHPNLITVYEIGHAGDQHFIAIEYVNGYTLRELISRGSLTIRDSLDIAKQVASALSAAHEAGIAHRDIKPENIMIRPDGLVKVLDFGLAKQTEKQRTSVDPNADTSDNLRTDPGTVMGTPHYMSPEQARGVSVDSRTDIFSLGAVLYEMVTRRTPFEGETSTDLIAELLKTDPLPISQFASDAPADLQRVIDKAMRKRRDERYQTARDLQMDLKSLKHEVKYRTTQFEKPTLLKVGFEAPVEDLSTQVIKPESAGLIKAIPQRLAALSPQDRWRISIRVARTLLLIAIVFGGLLYLSRPRPLLSIKDTILVADFENKTGEQVFDGTLKQALSVQLGQTPFVNILPAERVNETLKLMNKPPEERITREIGREICERRNLKALLLGTITKLDRNYSLTIEALNSRTGEVLASAIAEAEGRDKVLNALEKASTELRSKLGESLASIRKFDVPIEQATTASLQALKDYSAGVEFRVKGQLTQAIPLLKRAVESDEKFALACLLLGVSYRDLRQIALGNKYIVQAYELRERVSEREKLEIASTYFRYITGELDKRLEATTLFTQTYKQVARGFHLHGNTYLITGQYEKAAEAYREVLQLDPDYGLSRANLALALIKLNRSDDAREIIEQGMARHLDLSSFHNRLY